MPARRKGLHDFVCDGTFLARRHAHLLREHEMLEDPELARLQADYIAEPDGLERLKIARRFERLVRGDRRPAHGGCSERAPPLLPFELLLVARPLDWVGDLGRLGLCCPDCQPLIEPDEVAREAA